MGNDSKEPKGILTVGKLRAYLDAKEAKWTEQDEKYLGKFEDLAILTLPSNKGYTYSTVEDFTGCGGYLVVPANEKGEAII